MDFSQLAAWVNSQAEPFTQALSALVNQNTYTANQAGVAQGMALLDGIALQLGCHIEALQGHHRLISVGDSRNHAPILLIAHMDTVHPPESGFLSYEPQAEGFVRGPGIGDIKGGLVMGLWTLHAIQQLLPGLPVQLVVSADEEIGSPTLKEWYLNNQAGARLAIGLEPGFPQGPLSATVPMGVVKSRRGCGRIVFSLQGKAAHAGGDWQNGLSAIEAMAQRIPAIHALSDPQREISTNVGLVSGGTAANTIAEACQAQVDYRFARQADADQTYQAIEQIVHAPKVYNPHLACYEQVTHFEQTIYLPPMEYTPQSHYLIETVLAEAERLGQTVVPINRGGGSDANYISGAGVPSICGMGAPAEGIHSQEERIHLPFLFRRLELLIGVVYRLGPGA
jgi:glutamate carboxypeptidase